MRVGVTKSLTSSVWKIRVPLVPAGVVAGAAERPTALPHLTSAGVRGARTRVVLPVCGLRKLHADDIANTFSDAMPDVAGTYAPVLFRLNVDERAHRDRLRHFHSQTCRRAVNPFSAHL